MPTHPAYGRKHQRIRTALINALIAQHTAGEPPPPCPRCGHPMHPHQPLDLGHTNPETKQAGQPGDRLEHTNCNRAAGDTPTHHPPPGYDPSRNW